MIIFFTTAFLTCFSMCLLAFFFFLIKKKHGILDFFWGLSITTAIIISTISFPFKSPANWLFYSLVILWGIRLTAFFAIRMWNTPDDRRYKALIQESPYRMALQCLIQSLLQTLLVATAYPFTLGVVPTSHLMYGGAIISLLGIIGEITADIQLSLFKKHHTGICTHGLWRYSRHPNLFFETIVWIGLSLFFVDSSGFFVSLIGPVSIFIVTYFITGPVTEKCSIERHGEHYKKYQATTPYYFPFTNYFNLKQSITQWVILVGCSALAIGSTPTISTWLSKTTTADLPSVKTKGELINDTSTIPFTMSYKKTSYGLLVDVFTPLTQSEVDLDQNFNVRSATFNVTDDELSEKLKYTKRLAKRNNLNEVVFEFFNDRQQIKKKGVYYTLDTIDTFSIIPVLQSLAGSKGDIFSAEFSVQHMALKVPVVITKTITTDFTAFFLGYTVPPKILAMTQKNNKPRIIYTLKVMGWQGFIYNHRHFYAYDSTPPYIYVGHWGGPKETHLFSWAFNNELLDRIELKDAQQL